MYRTRHNTDWYVHPDYPHLLLVISTSSTDIDEQLFIPYGGDFFCHERFSLPVLSAAICCYNIPIHDSPSWRTLPLYNDLCNYFPKQQPDNTSTTIQSIVPITTATNTSTRPARQFIPQTREVTSFLAKLVSSDCPMDIHLKPDVAVALERTSRRPLIDTVINTLRRNDTIHALYMQGARMSSGQLNRLLETLATTLHPIRR